MRSLILALVFTSLAAHAFAQSVVVNKIQHNTTLINGHNTAEIELLVIQDHLDMRGMVVKDYSATSANDGGGAFTFNSIAMWSDMRAGTLIDLPEDTTAADINAADYVLNVGLENTTYFTQGTAAINVSNGEFIEIKSSGSAQAGQTGHIHGLTDSSPTGTQFNNAPTPKLNSPTAGSSSAIYAKNSTAALADFNGSDAATGSFGSIIFGQGNTATNTTYINSLRGVVNDDPNINLGTTILLLNAPNTLTTGTVALAVQNTGAAQNLNVTSVTITGPGAAKFSVGALPTAIGPNTTKTLTVRFNPGGVAGVSTATLTLGSNDQSHNTPSVILWGGAANTAPFAGLYITEVCSAPGQTNGEDEFIEIKNTTGTAINIGGVTVSDEDNNNTEGSAIFPAGTILAPQETIVVSTGNGDIGSGHNPVGSNPPTWLPNYPHNTRIFLDPSRSASGWTLPTGVTVTTMTRGTATSNIALSGGDGCALYAPNVKFFASVGPFPVTGCIDGMNYPQGDTGPANPINSTGQLDTPATKAPGSPVAGVQPAQGDSLTRTQKGANTASNIFYSELPISPGTSLLGPTVNAAHDWEVFE